MSCIQVTFNVRQCFEHESSVGKKIVAQSLKDTNQSQSVTSHAIENINIKVAFREYTLDGRGEKAKKLPQHSKCACHLDGWQILSHSQTPTNSFIFSKVKEILNENQKVFWVKPTQYFLSSYHSHKL